MDFLIIFSFLVFLFLSCFFTFYFTKNYFTKKNEFETYNLIKKQRKEAIDKARHILKGQFSEHLSPFEKDFPAKSSECRFFGAPIDFICFEGIDEKNITKIKFIEIKSAKSRLSEVQKSLKKTIEEKNIEFIEYRINK